MPDRGPFGYTVPVTNRGAWGTAEVVEAHGQPQHVEHVFRRLKGGGWRGWSPACDGIHSKLEVQQIEPQRAGDRTGAPLRLATVASSQSLAQTAPEPRRQ